MVGIFRRVDLENYPELDNPICQECGVVIQPSKWCFPCKQWEKIIGVGHKVLKDI